MLTLYCDESGYTGPDLLNQDQPFFSYASVLIDPHEAEELLSQAKLDFRLQGTELKGSRMLGSSPGRKAATFLFEKLADRSITVVSDKKFALSGKLYEYIFDPVVEGNSALYNVGFHKCVTNLLYDQFTSHNAHVVEVLTTFQRCVRARDFTGLVTSLTGGHIGAEASQLAQSISKFCFEQQSLIEAEFADSGIEAVDKWGLDLSSTSVTSLLRLWAERNIDIHLVLDDSKPLSAWANAIRDHFPVRTGPQEPGRYIEVEGRRHRLNFALAEPLRFASSKQTAGLQLADVMAAFISQLLTERHNRPTNPLLKEAILRNAIDSGSIFPDSKYIDPGNSFARKNLALLTEMFRASARGDVIAEVIPQLAQAANRR